MKRSEEQAADFGFPYFHLPGQPIWVPFFEPQPDCVPHSFLNGGNPTVKKLVSPPCWTHQAKKSERSEVAAKRKVSGEPLDGPACHGAGQTAGTTNPFAKPVCTVSCLFYLTEFGRASLLCPHCASECVTWDGFGRFVGVSYRFPTSSATETAGSRPCLSVLSLRAWQSLANRWNINFGVAQTNR